MPAATVILARAICPGEKVLGLFARDYVAFVEPRLFFATRGGPPSTGRNPGQAPGAELPPAGADHLADSPRCPAEEYRSAMTRPFRPEAAQPGRAWGRAAGADWQRSSARGHPHRLVAPLTPSGEHPGLPD